MNDLEDYYTRQAGTGIVFYNGIRNQRGQGFFGQFFKGTLLPLLKSVGHRLLSTGVDVADDVINNDVDPMTALKSRGRVAVRSTANDLISRARSGLDTMKQNGSGRRRKRMKSIKSIKGSGIRTRRTVKTKRRSKKRTSPKRKLRRVTKSNLPEFLEV